MIAVLGRPLAAALTGLGNWLNGLTGTSAILLGIILGLMMCFDLGGPINKVGVRVRHRRSHAPTASGTPLVIMATVMAAGMVPPLAMALSTAVRPKLYTPAERENGKAAWLLGLSFISEGAIPFAAADPFRVIPSMMLGGAITGAIVAGAGVQLRAPHGGIFVFFAISGLLWFVVALVAGTVVGALAVTVLKSFGRSEADDATEDAVDLDHIHAPDAFRRARPPPDRQAAPHPPEHARKRIDAQSDSHRRLPRSGCTPVPRHSSPRRSARPACRSPWPPRAARRSTPARP